MVNPIKKTIPLRGFCHWKWPLAMTWCKMTPDMFCYWDCFIAFATLETKTMGCLPPIIEKKTHQTWWVWNYMCHGQNMVNRMWSSIPQWDFFYWVYQILLLDWLSALCAAMPRCEFRIIPNKISTYVYWNFMYCHILCIYIYTTH